MRLSLEWSKSGHHQEPCEEYGRSLMVHTSYSIMMYHVYVSGVYRIGPCTRLWNSHKNQPLDPFWTNTVSRDSPNTCPGSDHVNGLILTTKLNVSSCHDTNKDYMSSSCLYHNLLPCRPTSLPDNKDGCPDGSKPSQVGRPSSSLRTWLGAPPGRARG